MDHNKNTKREIKKRKGKKRERNKKGKKERKENNPQLCPNCRLLITVDNKNESHKEHSWNFNS